jgi:hypothetical protein
MNKIKVSNGFEQALCIIVAFMMIFSIANCAAQTNLCQFTSATITAFDLTEDQNFDTSAFDLTWASNLPNSGTFDVGLNEFNGFCDTTVAYVINVIAATVELTPSPICLNGQDDSMLANGASVPGGQYFINGLEVTSFALADIGSEVQYIVTLPSGCVATATAILTGAPLHLPQILISQ